MTTHDGLVGIVGLGRIGGAARLQLTRRLGVEGTAVRSGVAEDDGIPPALRRAYS